MTKRIARDEYARALADLVDDYQNPTAKYKAYLDCEQAYEETVRLRDRARKEAMKNPRAAQQWPIAGRRYGEQIDAAMSRWEVVGSKAEVQAALLIVRRHDSPASRPAAGPFDEEPGADDSAGPHCRH